jgi:tetratricopeptide (TPR) repeat protein
LSQNKYSQALDHARLCNKLAPHESRAYYLQAQIAIALSSPSEALQLLDQSLKCDEKNQEALYLRAQLLRERNQTNAALNDLNALLAMHPDNAEILGEKALLLTLKGHGTEASGSTRSAAAVCHHIW